MHCGIAEEVYGAIFLKVAQALVRGSREINCWAVVPELDVILDLLSLAAYLYWILNDSIQHPTLSKLLFSVKISLYFISNGLIFSVAAGSAA